MKTIYLAGGCYWGAEKYISKIKGVVETEVGFANGDTDNPTYEQVKHENTGHAETVKVTYDETVLPLYKLLRLFSAIIEPTVLDRQGHDEGHQYRTGVYYTDPAEEAIVKSFLKDLQMNYEDRIVTECLPLEHFYTAEEYHQKYLDKNPGGYCHVSWDDIDWAEQWKRDFDQDPCYFVKLGKEYEEEILAFKKEVLDSGVSTTDGCGNLFSYDSFDDYLENQLLYTKEETVPEGKVVGSQLYYIRESDRKVIGCVNVRHYLNDMLREAGGNVGYSVTPSERRKGYATRMLHDVLPYLRSVGITDAMVTCNDTNVGSRKTILNNGGVFIGNTVFEEDGEREIVEKYLIDLSLHETVEGKRVRLRKARVEDTEEIFNNVWSREKLAEMMLWVVTDNLEDAKGRMERTIDRQKQGPAYFIEYKESGEVIGFAGIMEIAPDVYDDCGICIMEKYQGQGLGTEVISLLVGLGFRGLMAKEIHMGHIRGNEASKHAIMNNGFRPFEEADEVRERDGMGYTAVNYKLERIYGL